MMFFILKLFSFILKSNNFKQKNPNDLILKFYFHKKGRKIKNNTKHKLINTKQILIAYKPNLNKLYGQIKPFRNDKFLSWII